MEVPVGCALLGAIQAANACAVMPGKAFLPGPDGRLERYRSLRVGDRGGTGGEALGPPPSLATTRRGSESIG